MKSGLFRRLFYILTVLVCFFLQTAIFPHLAIAGITPNLLAAVTVSVGFLSGSYEGALAGLLGGFLLDISFGGILGAFMLFFSLLGYLSGIVSDHFYDEAGYLPMLMMAFCDLAYSVFVYIGYFLIRGRVHVLYYLTHIILPEILYTCITGWLLFNLLKTPLKRMKPA